MKRLEKELREQAGHDRRDIIVLQDYGEGTFYLESNPEQHFDSEQEAMLAWHEEHGTAPREDDECIVIIESYGPSMLPDKNAQTDEE